MGHQKEDGGHHPEGSQLHRPQGCCQQAHPWLHCQRHREGLPRHLPSSRCSHPQSKVMKRPRFDLTKLMDMHGEGTGKATVSTDPNTGEVVERPEGYEPPVMESV